jgi:hypothetical protein
MVKDSDPPRRPQPLIDTVKIVKGLEQSQIWREQQAAIAKLREGLALPPDLAEALRQMKEETARLDAEALAKAKEEAAPPSPEPAATTETVAEPTAATAPAVAAESAVEPAPVDETAAPIKRKRPKQWAAEWMEANPKGKDEGPGEYAQRMYDDMVKAPDVTAAWSPKTCQRELYRPPKEADFEPDPNSLQTFPKHH